MKSEEDKQSLFRFEPSSGQPKRLGKFRLCEGNRFRINEHGQMFRVRSVHPLLFVCNGPSVFSK